MMVEKYKYAIKSEAGPPCVLRSPSFSSRTPAADAAGQADSQSRSHVNKSESGARHQRRPEPCMGELRAMQLTVRCRLIVRG